MTTWRPVRSSWPEWPLATDQESAKSQMPKVERPPSRPPTCRHGQIGRQLQASKYVPSTAHASVWLSRNVPPRAVVLGHVWSVGATMLSSAQEGGCHGEADPRGCHLGALRRRRALVCSGRDRGDRGADRAGRRNV